jgi:murein tripeptide amidase MpaA
VPLACARRRVRAFGVAIGCSDYERHLDLIARCSAAPGASVRSLGQSLDGRELECVEVGSGPLHCWVIHRQHPGESQASFFAEGLLTRLLGLGDAEVRVDLT